MMMSMGRIFCLCVAPITGITAPLSAFLGESCLFIIVIFVTAAWCQRGHLVPPEAGQGGHVLGEEF